MFVVNSNDYDPLEELITSFFHPSLPSRTQKHLDGYVEGITQGIAAILNQRRCAIYRGKVGAWNIPAINGWDVKSNLDHNVVEYRSGDSKKRREIMVALVKDFNENWTHDPELDKTVTEIRHKNILEGKVPVEELTEEDRDFVRAKYEEQQKVIADIQRLLGGNDAQRD